MNIRKRHPSRDAVEGLLSALILVLIIRHFAFEVFKIPTGSMAPTLLGAHRDMLCPNCGYSFPVEGGKTDQGLMRKIEPLCPNCGYAFAEQEASSARCRCFLSFLLRGGDNRVIVNKFLGRFRSPKRWDVTVFRYPYVKYRCLACGTMFERDERDPSPKRCIGPYSAEGVLTGKCGSRLIIPFRTTYIKRLVGLPGEHLEILHGDIYVNGTIARKPREIQDSLWRMVFDSRYVAKAPQPGYFPRWHAADGTLSAEGQTLELTPGVTGSARAEYLPPILDYIAYNGWNRGVVSNTSNDIRRDGRNTLFPIGDLRWTARVRTDGPGEVRLVLIEDEVEYVATVCFGESTGKTSLTAGGRILAESDFRAEPRTACTITFANWDDALLVTADGKAILESENVVRPDLEAYRNGAAVAASGCRATFERLRLDRDLYYLKKPADRWPEERSFQVPPNGYFFCGDNARNSFDSRYWGYAPAENVVGDAAVVWWPLNRLQPIH